MNLNVVNKMYYHGFHGNAVGGEEKGFLPREIEEYVYYVT